MGRNRAWIWCLVHACEEEMDLDILVGNVATLPGGLFLLYDGMVHWSASVTYFIRTCMDQV